MKILLALLFMIFSSLGSVYLAHREQETGAQEVSRHGPHSAPMGSVPLLVILGGCALVTAIRRESK